MWGSHEKQGLKGNETKQCAHSKREHLSNTFNIWLWLATFSVQSNIVNISDFKGYTSLSQPCNYSALPLAVQASSNAQCKNETQTTGAWLCSNRTLTWTLKFDFRIIFMCKILFSFNNLIIYKPFLAPKP